MRMLEKMKNLVVEEKGQAVTEYGLIIGIVAIGVVTILGLLRDELVSVFNTIKNSI
jgi:pilus assembly protein Flp/PilA